MGISYIEKLEQGNTEYSLKSTDNFDRTDDLGKALEAFFEDKSKGIHIAAVCTDSEIMSNNNLQRLFYAFKTTDENLCKIDLGRTKSGDWKSGNYYYFDYAESIIKSMEIIIGCAKNLGIDTSVAEHVYRYSIDNPFINDIWSRGNAWQFSQIVETSSGCANICILLILPEKFFATFQAEDHYFPFQLEYVVKGVSPLKLLEATEKELAETKVELTTVKKERDDYKQLCKGTGAIDNIKI